MKKQIEVEKKVKLEAQHLKEIEKRAIFLRQIQIKDTYFDKLDFNFTAQNMWLRERDGQFELKRGIKKERDSVDYYEEIKENALMRTYLNLDHKGDFLQALIQSDIHPFCSFVTDRKCYQLGEIFIDIDKADFGDLTYVVAEFEVMVDCIEKIKDAEEKIQELLVQMHIDSSIIIPAKLTYYLYHKRFSHYETLVTHKVIKPINF